MKTYTLDEFVDYCRTRGDDEYNVMNHRACAVTQFLQTKDPDITSSYLSAGSICAFGYNKNEKAIRLAEIVGLTKGHVDAVYQSYSFSGIVYRFDKLKKN